MKNKKGKYQAFVLPVSTLSCKISPRIKGYESKYPSRMNSPLKFVNVLTLDLIMNDEGRNLKNRAHKFIFQEKCHLEFEAI